MSTTTARARRIKALGRTPVPPELAAKAAALETLHRESVRLAGADRERWFKRCANGTASPEDLAKLALLPEAALKAAGADDALDYARFMVKVLESF